MGHGLTHFSRWWMFRHSVKLSFGLIRGHRCKRLLFMIMHSFAVGCSRLGKSVQAWHGNSFTWWPEHARARRAGPGEAGGWRGRIEGDRRHQISSPSVGWTAWMIRLGHHVDILSWKIFKFKKGFRIWMNSSKTVNEKWCFEKAWINLWCCRTQKDHNKRRRKGGLILESKLLSLKQQRIAKQALKNLQLKNVEQNKNNKNQMITPTTYFKIKKDD